MNNILSNKVYSDPKGFFTINPPDGWNVQDFPSDPRGKVKILCNSAQNTMLQVIAQSSPFDDFEALVRNSELEQDNLKTKYNATITTERCTFDNVPALRANMTFPGRLKQMHISFILGGILYNIVYGAPPSEYDAHFNKAQASIDSFVATPKNLSAEEELKHFVATRIRTAKLNIEIGDKKRAIELVDEGLHRSPDDKTLLELRQKITDNRD